MKRSVVLLLLASLPFQAGLAQETGTIAGTVTAQETGAALASVSVAVVGLARAGTTGPDGRYTILGVPPGTYQVRARLIGFRTTVDSSVVVAAGQTVTADFRLVAQAIQLDTTIVAIGYATVQKKDLTGAVGSVSGDAVTTKAAPTSTVNTALEGRAAGVQVLLNSGMPGVGASVRIRGTNSISANSEPLYVIDGVPAEQGSSSSDPKSNPLMSIDPNEIESIDVLKDASATAIYGSRGANGVVLITTKRGPTGESRVTMTTSYGFQDISKTIPVLTAPQYMQLVNDARYYNTHMDAAPKYSDQQIANAQTYNYPALMLRSCSGWQFCSAAPQANQAISISGGAGQMRYLLSGNFMRQEGILVGSDFQRYGVRLNVDADMNARVKVGSSMSLTRVSRMAAAVENASVGAGANGILAAMQFDPSLPPKDANGNWNMNAILSEQVANPLANSSALTDLNTTSRLVGNVFGELSIANGLKLKTTLGGTFSLDGINYYAPRTISPGSPTKGDAFIQQTPWRQLLNDNTLTWHHSAGPGALDLMGDVSVQTYHSEYSIARAQGCASDATAYNAFGSCSILRPSESGATDWALLSYLGRANYNLNDRYLFTLSARTDGSSRFAPGNKWAFFPSVAFAWRLASEPFMQNQALFSDLKLRVSYGRAGNQGISPYSTLQQLAVCWYSFGGTEFNSLCPRSTEGNPALTWESQNQGNVGLDASLLKNRVTVSLDAYHSVTHNLLLTVPLPITTGFSSQPQNVGSMRNNGLELSLSTVNVTGHKFNWRSTLNIAGNRNKVLDLGSTLDTAGNVVPLASIPAPDVRGGGFIEGGKTNILMVGQPLGTIYGFKTAGLWQAGDQCYLTNTGECTPGEYKVVDVNGDGKIDLSDRTVIGHADPKFYGGFSNSVSYGPVSLDVFLTFSYGNDVVDLSRVFNDIATGYLNERADVLNRWTPENTSTDVPRANAARPRRLYSALVEDGSYIRLQTLTLGCQLPARLLWGAHAARLYVTGQNLWIASHYKGFDPEVNSLGGDPRMRGIDDGAYPRSRVWNLGLTLTL